jgi:hypothetical protein
MPRFALIQNVTRATTLVFLGDFLSRQQVGAIWWSRWSAMRWRRWQSGHGFAGNTADRCSIVAVAAGCSCSGSTSTWVFNLTYYALGR